ncbi:RQC-minor-1 family DNA-binding protein [Radiobacillus sp. PE A8.2]|uniref:RQC-minor-1 family DNA-binding protein n=1 Tax=Radiobacillus sp. PE A8.2 TaxID=3380349 RepID=UPI00388E6ACD
MNTNQLVLSESDIRAILRAADELIAQGGRTLLAKILKGSREKKILELGLDACPVYGYFRAEKLDYVMAKIDWMIDHDFLDISYRGKLPMLVFTERGWMIESEQRVEEFLQEWNLWLEQGKSVPDMYYLKDRNRGMILSFLERIRETKDQRYIPFLQAWEKIEYKKVRAEIGDTIRFLGSDEPVNQQTIRDREKSIQEALVGMEPQDLLIKCMECGNRFTFTVGEQQFFKQKGFQHPRRCGKCRRNR